MKSLRCFMAVFAYCISVDITDAQIMHTYFPEDVYTGHYAQEIPGHIMMHTQGNYVRFKILYGQNNILYYSDGINVAAITANGSVIYLALTYTYPECGSDIAIRRRTTTMSNSYNVLIKDI